MVSKGQGSKQIRQKDLYSHMTIQDCQYCSSKEAPKPENRNLTLGSLPIGWRCCHRSSTARLELRLEGHPGAGATGQPHCGGLATVSIGSCWVVSDAVHHFLHILSLSSLVLLPCGGIMISSVSSCVFFISLSLSPLKLICHS